MHKLDFDKYEIIIITFIERINIYLEKDIDKNLELFLVNNNIIDFLSNIGYDNIYYDKTAWADDDLYLFYNVRDKNEESSVVLKYDRNFEFKVIYFFEKGNKFNKKMERNNYEFE